MKTVLLGFLTQILLTVGSIVAAGFFIHACKRLFIRACGRFAPQIVNYSGIIGTPVHELSHAAMCIIFRHKIKKIKLFGINKRSGTLGYVQHAFNPRSIWQRTGNFFIGIAPVVSGSLVILLLLFLFLPSAFSQVTNVMRITADGDLTTATFTRILSAVPVIFSLIFTPENLDSWQLWVFAVLAVTIAIHMELSTADIKGGWNGFLFLSGIFLLIDIALYFINPAWLTAFTNALVQGGLILISLLLLSAVFAAIVGVFSLFIILLKKIF